MYVCVCMYLMCAPSFVCLGFDARFIHSRMALVFKWSCVGESSLGRVV